MPALYWLTISKSSHHPTNKKNRLWAGFDLSVFSLFSDGMKK